MSLSSLTGWQLITLISPVFTYILLVYISGVRILEERGKKKWGHLDSYKDYVKKTPTLLFK
jgi:steroid 5-alpha reductase family enzyme